MTAEKLQRLGVAAFLIAVATYAILFSVPIMLEARYSGLSGRLDGDGLQITHVRSGSPAADAGLRVGDRLVAWAGREVAGWSELYVRDAGRFLAESIPAADTPVTVAIVRGGSRSSLDIVLRRAAQEQGLSSFALRVTFVLLIAGLALFIVWSGPVDALGFAAAQGLCFAVLMILAGTRYTQTFIGPYMGHMSAPQFGVVATVATVATLLLLSSVVWFILMFPDGWRGSRWVLPLVYGLPLLLLASLLLSASGSLSERLSAIHPARQWATAGLLITSCALVLRNYVTVKSALKRERIRWIGMTILLVASFNLTFWSLPKWFLGRPLLANIDWLFLPASLVPLAILVSIDKHHLFGIPGIVRRRLRILERQLRLEQDRIARKDERIRALGEQISQLRAELREHVEYEQPRTRPGSALSARYRRLEQAHPYLKTLREQQLIGAHECWEAIFERVVMAAKIKRSVFIRGESGTGKTDVARAIHRLSPEQDCVYREVSCAQFEHGDPAFALGRFFGVGKDHGVANIPKEGRPGLLEECDGGTLFLDDVDRLPLHVQDLLLYPLEGKPFEAGIGVGGPFTVDVKFIFASNRDLNRMEAEGTFRGDLLARIGTRLEIPPLRERREDIPALIDFMMPRICRELEHEISSISAKAMQLLCAYSYERGNVRELERELESAVARALLEEDGVLRAGYLSQRVQSGGEATALGMPAAGEGTTATPKAADARAESRELTVLREHHFRIKESETALGLSNRSRTLSNHLRGICIESLSEVDWDVVPAARRVVGDADPLDNEKIQKKMLRFLERIRLNVGAGREASLFNNLPTRYHPALRRTITWVRSSVAAGKQKG